MVLKTDIPIVDGVDVTKYQNIPRSVDYFFDIPEEMPKYIANVNKEGYGLLQVSTKRLRSRKLFSWGKCNASDHWQEFLTDQAGRYVEIQAGLAKTQYGCLPMAPHTAWEWVERYGPVQVDPEMLDKSGKERTAWLTGKLMEEKIPEELENRRISTKSLAKSPAEVIWKGSGFGAMRPYTRGAEHLAFEMKEPGLLRWKEFLEAGKLGEKNPLERPDEFCVDQENYPLLEQAVDGEEAKNWYAWYLLGIGYYTADRWEDSRRAFERSWELEENPWAAHGTATACMMQDAKEPAALWIARGIAMRKEDVSYLKEGMKLLFQCESYETLKQIYEELNETMRNVGKLKFLYISALHALGEDGRAYELLEENGGLEMEDIREGEDSIAQLWTELKESVTGERGEVPYRYDFKAY